VGAAHSRKFEKKINLMRIIIVYILCMFHADIFANADETVLQEQIKQKNNINVSATLRILNKLTGRTQDFTLSSENDTIEMPSLKIKYKNAFIEKVTASTKVLWVFIEVWYKDTQFTNDEWTLHYSNWLCNLDDRFSNKEWGIHILGVK